MKKHISILVDEVNDHIPVGTQLIVDGTAGHGGHLRAMIDHMGSSVAAIGIDRDPVMIARLQQQQEEGQRDESVRFVQTPYDTLGSALSDDILGQIDYLLLDIGINREHIIDAERGFSIKSDGPLDMRFDPTTGQTAREYLIHVTREELATRLQQYGDFSPQRADEIALCITQQRRQTGLQTTYHLKALLKGLGLNDRKIAVVFQVVRIQINQELQHLENFLATFPAWLAPGGRCAIITFHSIEDRMVKQAFKSLHASGSMQLVHKKAIQPSRQEKEKNKASRSAKLRVIQKL